MRNKLIQKGLLVYTVIVLVVMMVASVALLTTERADAQQTCPYESTQVFVKTDDGEWSEELELASGDSFQVGLFHNGQIEELADDAFISIHAVTPDNGKVKSYRPPNGYSFSTDVDVPKTYRVMGYTRGNFTDGCTDKAEVVTSRSFSNGSSGDDASGGGNVLGADTQATSLQLIKQVITPKDPFEVGNTVKFRVALTNTGTETVTTLPFTDDYPALKMRPIRVLYGSGEDITGSFAIDYNNGTVSIEDITQVFSDMEPGEEFVFDIEFMATASGNRICNEAIAAEDFVDSACIRVIEKPPVTDL